MSEPALYEQLDKSAWLWTPPGAARKRYDKVQYYNIIVVVVCRLLLFLFFVLGVRVQIFITLCHSLSLSHTHTP
jgi:hypothetical protein